MSLFYRDADAAIVIFDYSDIKSLNGVEYWINWLKDKVDPEDLIIKVIGNKTDFLNLLEEEESFNIKK